MINGQLIQILIKSTIVDLTKYLLLFLNEGKLNDNKIILEKYFIKEMIKPRIFMIIIYTIVMDFKFQKLIIEDI